MSAALLDNPTAVSYETDETGWLEETARLIAQRRYGELDYPHLEEYLTDMGIRDRREVWSRLHVLLTHWLKWEFQPDHRSNSWRATIRVQQAEIGKLLDSGTLLNHARDVLNEAYELGVELAAAETGLPMAAFPPANSRTLEEWLALGFDP